MNGHAWSCPAGAFGGIGACVCAASADTPPEPFSESLSAAPPDTWKAREDRVGWVNHNFTRGEKAKLYRILRLEFRFKDYERIERDEEKSLRPKEAKKVWP